MSSYFKSIFSTDKADKPAACNKKLRGYPGTVTVFVESSHFSPEVNIAISCQSSYSPAVEFVAVAHV